MLVKEIMTPKEQLVTVSPMATVRDALKLMREHKVRSVIVEKSTPSGAYGLLTFKNILQSIIAEDGETGLHFADYYKPSAIILDIGLPGIDGWRLDMAYEIHPEFWRRFRKTVKERYPDAYLVAEEWRDPSPLLHGDMFDGATHYQLRELLFDFFLRNALSADSFARALETLRRRLPPGAEWGMLTLLGSHDTPRVLTECSGDTELVILMFTFLFTYPGVPLIYYGDENGMVGGSDPDCRRPMVWDEAKWNHKIRESVRRLIFLRREIKALRRGIFKIGYAEDRIFSFYRSGEEESVLVILNNTPVVRNIKIPVAYEDGTILTDGLSGESYRVSRGCLCFDPLPPRRSWVLITESDAVRI